MNVINVHGEKVKIIKVHLLVSELYMWCTVEALPSARQTERLDHRSFTSQQQKSWNCRKLLFRDKCNDWLTMKICEGVLWSGTWTGLFFEPPMEANEYEVENIVRIRDMGFTADIDNTRSAWLTSSRTKSESVKLFSVIFIFIHFCPY